MVIAAVGMFFWLMVRPTADEEGSAFPRATSDGATGRYSSYATTDAQSHAPLKRFTSATISAPIRGSATRATQGSGVQVEFALPLSAAARGNPKPRAGLFKIRIARAGGARFRRDLGSANRRTNLGEETMRFS
jgi:hypothetical protein